MLTTSRPPGRSTRFSSRQRGWWIDRGVAQHVGGDGGIEAVVGKRQGVDTASGDCRAGFAAGSDGGGRVPLDADADQVGSSGSEYGEEAAGAAAGVEDAAAGVDEERHAGGRGGRGTTTCGPRRRPSARIRRDPYRVTAPPPL